MSDQQPEQAPERIDADVTPDDSAGGTSTGNPVAGVEIDEAEAERAVEPEDNSVVEVEGPQASAGHA